jgi:serine/threonine protein phosphatase PrpC
MFITAKFLGVKKDQDFAHSDSASLVICDGIGSHDNSRAVSEEVVSSFFEKNPNGQSEVQKYIEEVFAKIKNNEIKGGTTFIQANIKSNNSIDINYLGDGGIVFLSGDFGINTTSEVPYRYVNLMLPHKNAKGQLTKHISSDSSIDQIQLSNLKVSVNSPNGNILLFFSDGINTLEENIIIQDRQERYWRHESGSIQYVLSELDLFIKEKKDVEDFSSELGFFTKEILAKLNEKNMLDDDASLGIIITDEVLNYYKRKSDLND